MNLKNGFLNEAPSIPYASLRNTGGPIMIKELLDRSSVNNRKALDCAPSSCNSQCQAASTAIQTQPQSQVSASPIKVDVRAWSYLRLVRFRKRVQQIHDVDRKMPFPHVCRSPRCSHRDELKMLGTGSDHIAPSTSTFHSSRRSG
jgi:hypothetical protein